MGFGKRLLLLLFCILIPGCPIVLAQVTVDTIHVIPAFRHILVTAYIVPGTSAQTAMTVSYRQQGSITWIQAHPGVRSTNDPYWLSTALFGLSQDTAYELHVVVTDPAGATNGDQSFTVQTRSDAAPAPVSGSTYHVSPTGDDAAGDGSEGNPWQSLARADADAAPGDTVLIHGGTYPGGQTISVSSGSAGGGYILYRAAPGEIPVFDGSDPVYVIPNSGNHFSPVAGRPGVYSTTPGYEPVYVAAGSDRLYNYGYDENTPLDSLTSGTVTHNGVSYTVPGWLYQSGTLYVHLSADADPDTISMHVVAGGPGIEINNPDFIAIQGLTIRYMDVGIRVRGDHEAAPSQPSGRYAWIDGNTLDHVNNTGILTVGWLSCGSPLSTDASIGAPGAVIVRNSISDASNVTTWPWDIKKGSDAENGAINLEGGDGAVAADNTIHDIFNGIAASNWGDCFWGGFPLESAGMNRAAVVEKNTMTDIGDDMLEPEGAIVNFVMQENRGLRLHTGISMAPIGEGPVWVLRNEVVDYAEGGMKFWDGMDVDRGWIIVYHNTFVTRLSGSDAVLIYPASSYDVKVVMRNNIFQGTQMAMDAGDSNWGFNASLDYDDYFSTTGYVPAAVWYYQGTVTCPDGGTNDHCWYDSVSQWIADSLAQGQPQEQHGWNLNPSFVDLPAGDFHLSQGSPLLDEGALITGINSEYAGSGPDPGAYESNGAPSNDECGSALIIATTPYSHTSDTTLATADPADPLPCAGSGNNSVWFRFTAPVDATLTADTAGSDYNTVLSVWSGSCSSPGFVDCNDDSGGQQSQVSFAATAGTTYYFQVSDAGSGGGNLTFHLVSSMSVLFFDDFEDGIESWTGTKGTWSESGGFLSGTTTRKADRFAPLPWPASGLTECSECTVEADIRLDTAPRASLLAWYHDKRNTVEIRLFDDRDKVLLLQKSGGVTVQKYKVPLPLTSGVTYHLAVQYAGGTFVVSLDGVTLFSVPAGTPPSGNVGFRVKSTTRTDVSASFGSMLVY